LYLIELNRLHQAGSGH